MLAGCAPADEQEAMYEGLSLADVAGTWSIQAMPETSDSVLVAYEMTATDNTEGWTVTFPGRDPMPVAMVAVEGDSIMVDLGSYQSALRDNVMVSTQSVVRLQEGEIIGTFVARYETTGADSVLRGRMRGTRPQ
jgi:hypothetical protein